MFTYIFGYYTTSIDNEKEIFEENQTDLENATERLSAYLEGEENLYEEIKLDFRQKVMDCQKYCDQRRRVLLQHVSDGNEQGTWRYSGQRGQIKENKIHTELTFSFFHEQ